MKIDVKRGSITAANDIIKYGLAKYFTDGVRFGFFNQEGDPKEICKDIILNLEEYGELELASKLKEILK